MDEQKILHDRPDKIKVVKGQRDSFGYELSVTCDFSKDLPADVIAKIKQIKRDLEIMLFGEEKKPIEA